MEFLTVKETAQLLRVSPITVRRYIAAGQLAAERVGRGIRVRRKAIEEFVTPVEPDALLGKPTTDDDPLWEMIGTGTSESPNDVASNKHKYLADAIVANWSDKSDEEVSMDRPRTIREGLGISVGIGRSGERTDIVEHKDEYLVEAYLSEFDDEDDAGSNEARVKPFTMEDPLWRVFGIGESDDPTEVAENKYDYVADAYLSDQE